MKSASVLVAAGSLALSIGAAWGGPANAEPSTMTRKVNAYVACINRLSERAYDSRARYFSWVGKKGPTGKERIIYGTYTIYDTADCKKGVEGVNASEPHDAGLEAAASSYVEAVVALEPLLKEADDYYTQENYKDDRMAKGKAMHPRLVAAWDAFANADQRLRNGIETLQDKQAAERIAEIERTEGKSARYHVETLMMGAKRLLRAQSTSPPDLKAMTAALSDYEGTVKNSEEYASANKDTIGSSFISAAKAYLVTAKQLMRRVRDKVGFDRGERMMIEAGGGWMIEGSPARLTRDYNQLVNSYNRGGRF